jgi:ketosteroid isomerase-like protein
VVDETAETRRTAREYVDRLERRDWPGVSELLDEHVVYELPQTRERIRGRAAFLRFNTEYPGDWHLVVRRVVADGRFAALWLDVRVGDEHQDACVWLELSEGGLVTRVTDYWPDPYEPPPGREHLAERY